MDDEEDREVPLEYSAFRWKGRAYKIPSTDTLEWWSWKGYTKTPDGEKTEPDDPNGWLMLLGWT